jgi:hypothetical protein
MSLSMTPVKAGIIEGNLISILATPEFMYKQPIKILMLWDGKQFIQVQYLGKHKKVPLFKLLWKGDRHEDAPKHR